MRARDPGCVRLTVHGRLVLRGVADQSLGICVEEVGLNRKD